MQLSQRNMVRSESRIRAAVAAVIVSALVLPATGQTADAPPVPSAAKQAVDARKAIYTLIGSNFRPVAEVLQGRGQYDAAQVQKRAARLAFLAEMALEAYPDASNTETVPTRAKPDIWSHRAEFDQRLKDFQTHTQALVQAAATEKSASDAFKAAASAVAQDCKGCHDNFREK